MLPRYDAHVIGRDDAIRLLEEQHADVSGLLEELADDAFVRRGTIGGGEWSAKDLALHLGSWELFALETLEQSGGANDRRSRTRSGTTVPPTG